MAVPVYSDLTTLKSYLGITVTQTDALLTMALQSASRAVDMWCERRFWLDPAPVARTFEPKYLNLLVLGSENDIGSTTGLSVATDPSGKGIYSVVWSAADWQLLPVNAPYASSEPEPWTSIRAVGTKTFPWLYNTWLTRRDRVQVTAMWGWPAVPAAVTQATLIKAARLYHRKDSAQGFAGVNEFGPVRLSKGEDPDVVSLLADYRDNPVLVA